jgi:serine/threonine protein kinase
MDYDFKKNDNEEDIREPSEAYKGGYCPINTGLVMNGYTIDKFIGEGAYSQVWRAFDKKKNLVVLKIHKGNKDDNKVGMNEYNILKKLEHPNIIKVYNKFIYKSEMGKHFVMVLEYLGDSLMNCKHHFRGDYDKNEDDKKRGESCVSLEVLRRMMKQLMDALNYLHNEKKIIHTDLKLDNIMLTKKMHRIKKIEDFNLKIVDFGTSHNINEKSNYDIGTVEYNSPEMIIGFPYNTTTDIWSCGCIFFELLTGFCLFDYSEYYDSKDDIDYNSDDTILYSSDDSEDEESYHIENLLLGMMMKVLGKFPNKMFKRGKFFHVFFTNRGYLKYKPRFLNEIKLYDYLIEEFEFKEEDAKKFEEFLLLMLNTNPDKRFNAKKILESKFLIK